MAAGRVRGVGQKPTASPAKIEEGLEHSRVLVLCMSRNAFGSDWAQLESGTFRFRDPLNQERRFIPLRLDEAPMKGSLAQFLYINWRPDVEKQEYAKLLRACRSPVMSHITATLLPDEGSVVTKPSGETSSATADYLPRHRDIIQQVFSDFEAIHAFFFKVYIDYLSLVDALNAGLRASDSDKARYCDYIRTIGQKLHEVHILEGRLAVVGASGAVRLMQQYRLQATEVNDILRLQLPCKKKAEVEAVANELFTRKDRLYEELARAFRSS